jgi:hypothetical protein
MSPAIYNRLNWPALIGFWLVIAAIYAVRAMYAPGTPLFADTDDAMRIVVVRDFLAGQGWWDNVQHRLNTPYGAEMHWSRLVDLPLAAILAALRLVLDARMAETILGYLWPALLLLTMLYVSAKLTLDLVGREGLLPALVLPALSPAVMAEFSPGRIDHHSIQIILALVMAWCAVRAVRSPRWAIGAGLAAATAMAIATEAVPAVIATVLGFGLLWVMRRERAGAMVTFGVTLAVASLVHLAIALPPERWFVVACDAMSIFYAAAGVAVGVAFAILAMLNLNAPGPRLAAGVIIGGIAAGVLVAFFRECLGGPYAAVDPWLVDNWLSRIVEARPVWESFDALPAYTVAIAVPPVLGLVLILWMLPRAGADKRVEWIMLAVSLAVAVAVMLVQVRGARLAMPLAIPAAAALIAGARHRYAAGKGITDAAVLVGSWLAFAGIALLVVVNGIGIAVTGTPPGSVEEAATTSGKEACLLPAAFDDLRGLPPERMMTPVDLGAHMLMETPHEVVAAPYHRNQQGVRDAFRFFHEPLEAVRPILAERGIGVVVTCPAMAEMQVGPGSDPASFVALYRDGALPDWLVDQSLPDAPLKVFGVLAEQP